MGKHTFKVYDQVNLEIINLEGKTETILCEVLETDGETIFKLRALEIYDWLFRAGFYEENGEAILIAREFCLN